MHKLGLIGYPLSHSLSAVIHKKAFETTSIEGTYELLQTPPEDLVDRIKFLKTQGYSGFNITIPHKVPTILFLSQVDKFADLSGSVNTVKILEDKSLIGFNTDVYGFIAAIPNSFKEIIKGSRATILGTGGAARAVAIALDELGVREIDFYARNVINAHDMVNFLRNRFPHIVFNLNQYKTHYDFRESKMLINTTPVGMSGFQDAMAIPEAALETLPFDALVYDIIYNPLKTRLIRSAKEHGKLTVGGLDMLIHQAARAFEIWTDTKPNTDAMKIAALEAMS